MISVETRISGSVLEQKAGTAARREAARPTALKRQASHGIWSVRFWLDWAPIILLSVSVAAAGVWRIGTAVTAAEMASPTSVQAGTVYVAAPQR